MFEESSQIVRDIAVSLLPDSVAAGISRTVGIIIFALSTSCQSAALVSGGKNDAGSPRAGAAAPRDNGIGDKDPREGEILALCTVRETVSGVVHRLEFLFNQDLGLYEVDHISIDSDLQENFRSYFARGNLKKDRISLELQESVTGKKFAELRADGRGQNGLLLGTVVFTQLQPVEQDNAECSVKF